MKNLLWIALAVLCLPAGAQEKQQARSIAAAVLMDNFETIASTRSDFLIDSESRIHSHFIPSENSLRFPFAYWLAGLENLGPGTAASVEKFYPTVMAGAKNFAAPFSAREGIVGMFSSDITYIAVNDSASQPDLNQILAKADYETVDGQRAWTWTTPPYEGHPDPTTRYAQQIGAYLVLSNNKRDFQTVVAALGHSLPVAVPPSLKTCWTHPYWLYRDIKARGQIALSSDVVSITMFTDLADGPRDGIFSVAVISNDLTMQREPNVLRDRSSGAGLLKPGDGGLWQGLVQFGLGKNNSALERLMYNVGFGLII